MPSATRRWAVAIGLVTFVVFLPNLRNQYLSWDDRDWIVENPHLHGITFDNLRWMFNTGHMGHYQPLSGLSLAADYEVAKALFGNGLDSRVSHFTNILLHCCNTVLVFYLALRLLALPDASPPFHPPARYAGAAFAAMFFGIHPLRLESVAWTTERRDVLSGLFVLLTVIAYLRYATGVPSQRRSSYLAALAFYACALFSKVIAAMLPLGLLVLDIYPLRRTADAATGRSRALIARVVEKLPFFLLALTVGAIGLRIQTRELVYSTHLHPVGSRVAQSFFGLSFYAAKTLAPVGLLPLYELPLALDPKSAPFIGAYANVALAAALIVVFRGRFPAVSAAAAWYVVFLLPVLGIFQTGPQLVADRYSYLSCLGWAICLGALLSRLLDSRSAASMLRPIGWSAATACLLILSVQTWVHGRIWRNDRAFWSALYDAAPNTAHGQTGIAYLLMSEERFAEAEPYLRRALALNPTVRSARDNLWIALKKLGRKEELLSEYRLAVQVEPNRPDGHYNLGMLLEETGDLNGAIIHLRRAAELTPTPMTESALAVALSMNGQFAEAVPYFQSIIASAPNDIETRFNLALAYLKLNRPGDARRELQEILIRRPEHAPARDVLGRIERPG